MRKLVFLVFLGLLASFAAQAQNEEKEPGVGAANFWFKASKKASTGEEDPGTPTPSRGGEGR